MIYNLALGPRKYVLAILKKRVRIRKKQVRRSYHIVAYGVYHEFMMARWTLLTVLIAPSTYTPEQMIEDKTQSHMDP